MYDVRREKFHYFSTIYFNKTPPLGRSIAKRNYTSTLKIVNGFHGKINPILHNPQTHEGKRKVVPVLNKASRHEDVRYNSTYR
jgi:hypothetical protein